LSFLRVILTVSVLSSIRSSQVSKGRAALVFPAGIVIEDDNNGE
jgi:hypothetical protein